MLLGEKKKSKPGEIYISCFGSGQPSKDCSIIRAMRKTLVELKVLNFLFVGTQLQHFSFKTLHVFLVLISHLDYHSDSCHEKTLWFRI